MAETVEVEKWLNKSTGVVWEISDPSIIFRLKKDPKTYQKVEDKSGLKAASEPIREESGDPNPEPKPNPKAKRPTKKRSTK